MVHTRYGSRIGILCVKHGSAKERKKIIKGMKGHVDKIARDQYGSLVLSCIVSTVDDTKLLNKIIIRELQKNLKEIVLDKNGRRVLLQLLHPNSSRNFSPDDLEALNLSIPNLSTKVAIETASETKSSKDGESNDEEEAKSDLEEVPEANDGGKKDPSLRRQELLVDSGLAESLVDICIESAGEQIRSNLGKEVMYEIMTGGSSGILHPNLDDKLNALYEAVASLVAEAKSEESEEEHVLENFHSSRTIRKLILDCPTFAAVLWKKALKGKCDTWAKGHSSKVISAFLESSDLKVLQLAKKELQPLIDAGTLKIPENKQSEN
jgi:pumilio family protein 6